MPNSIEFEHDGRRLEIRAVRNGEDIEAWVYEDGRPLKKVVSTKVETAVDAVAQGEDLVDELLKVAKSDIVQGITTLE